MSFPPDLVAEAVRHLSLTDPILADVIRRVGPFQLEPKRGRFQSLVRSILAQQISTAAARSVLKKLETRLAPRRISPASISDLSSDELLELILAQCKWIRQKVSYLQDLTAKVLDKSVRLHRLHLLTDEEVIAELLPVKGIGRWTVQMFLIFCLGRPDVFAPDDYGLRMAIQRLYGLPELPKRAAALEIAAEWQPYSTIASWYLWRSLETGAQ